MVDSLLTYSENRIPCEIQRFADELSLIATLESLSSVICNSISAWCKENGLEISAMKTNSVVFTLKK